MKAVTIAAAGAAVVTTVSAASHVKHMHAKLHANVARDNWVDWNATASTSATPVDGETKTTTTKTPVKAATTTASSSTSFLWEDWTSTSLAVDPAKTSSTTSSTTFTETWGDWTTTTSSLPVDPATTSTETWGDWSASSVVDPASTASTDEHTWGDWTTSDPVDPTSTVTETWSDWSTSAPLDPATTSTETWADWSSVDETTTITLASTITETKYVEPVSAISTSSSTWADWTSTSSVAVAAVSTSTSSSSSWFGPSAVEADSCAISIITSYGLPTWYPTPVLAVNTTTSTTSSTTSSATWADWTTTTSSTPAAAAVTSSSTSSYIWGDWISTATGSETAPGSAPTAETAYVSVSGGGSPASSGSASKPSGGSNSGSSGSSGISANGDSWGMTYSPYTAQGGCKDAGTIAADMTVIAQKGFTSVRVYSTDCSTLENIGGSARDNGLKLILGVWISATGISGAQGQVHDIVAWAQWDLVELIVVGNEAVFNGYCSASDLAHFISSSAAAFKAAGYTGAVTTTEPLSVWQDTSSASAFCSVVDVVGANLYAFFNADVTADKAGSFIQSEIDILDSICSGKAVYVLESGWPHAGNCNGLACPSPENQATALKGIQATAGAQVVFLSYEDEPWKEPGQFGVEQYWGCVNVF
ncbi:hypothetical protein AYL99_08487 [Fonsecaea erecta]|uniref:Probable beta-glucosidase btgE n=1 Tax=Fonsecaea erecta TaxID=1367422 RepID=A0A178ZD96_9EURO|nr:hypothetical protein AYL99_08487 [Fonsecaea erecta]OAP57749.1 hypothetical protein AYL99_08487 [Fonsecaea erecta]